MPNTDPPVTTRELALERIRTASRFPHVFYGLYMLVTCDQDQIRHAVEIQRELEQVVGLKLYAGDSVGNLGIIEEQKQVLVYETLSETDYKGVISVHCEKQELFLPELWNPDKPVTHSYARPERAEYKSVRDQLAFAEHSGFSGKLHITHVSSPISVELVNQSGVDVSCGVCPHHVIYDRSIMNRDNGVLWKMNPPLRKSDSREKLFQQLRQGKINWIETDHAPHTLEEKTNEHMSGIPGLAWWPYFEQFLFENGCSEDHMRRLTFDNAADRFELDIARTQRPLIDRTDEYAFDPYP